MSLQIWLPLNGNLKNQGLSDLTVTNNGATVDNNGKIGKCYRFDGDVYLNLSKGMDTTKDYSICYWVKEFENNTLGQFRVVYQCGGLIVGQYGTYLNIYNGSGSGLDVTAAIDTTTWHHACFTFQSSENLVTIYIDGKYATSKTVTSIPTSSSSAVIGKRSSGTHLFQGTLNDFRIYDHCLSQKEVQELAKGLVLHYRLAGPGQENIIEHSHNGNGWSIGSGWTAFTDGDGTKGYRFTRSGATSNNWVRVIPPTKINPNDYPEGITVSMDIKTPDISAVNHTCVGALQIYDSTGTRSGWCEPLWDLSKVKNNVWTKVSYFFTQAQLKTISQSGMTYSYTMFSFQLVQNGDISIKNFKAERGNVRTPWTPNKADAAWTTMGYSNNIEYDCSGFCNNGTKSGQLTWNVDSPRYTTSYKVGLTKAYVDTPNIIFEQMPQGTLNIWINRHSSTSDWRQYACFANAYNWTSNENDFIIIGSTGGAPLHLDCCSSTYSYTPTLNEWHMYTITWDLQQHTSNFYIDGELVHTTTNSRIDTLYASKHNYHAFGNRLSSDVNDYSMSDARIYSTVLSAEAVAELYHSAVIIDNTGKTYAYEYFEG